MDKYFYNFDIINYFGFHLEKLAWINAQKGVCFSQEFPVMYKFYFAKILICFSVSITKK